MLLWLPLLLLLLSAAGHYAIDTLIECNASGALLHAFDGKLGHALKGAAAGFHFSVPPSIVRSPQKQKLVKGLPLDRCVYVCAGQIASLL
jgi:TatD DNase family protein